MPSAVSDRALPDIRAGLAVVMAAVWLAGCASSDLPPPPPLASEPARTAPVQTGQAAGPDGQTVLAPNQLIPGLDAAAAAGPRPDPLGLVRVGLLLPLSGPSAPVGQVLLNAAQMALFDVGDERFVLQIYDTQGTPDGAVQATGLALAHGARLLLGPVFSVEAKAAGPQAAAAGVNMIAFSTDPTVAGPHVFVMGFLVQEQVRAIIAYARSQGRARFAALAPNSAYGQTVVNALETIVPAMGGAVSQVAYYDPTGADLNEVVQQLASYEQRKAALEEQRAALAAAQDEVSQLALQRLQRLETLGEVDFDAVVLPEQGGRLTQAASLLPFYDIDPGRVQLIGTLLWNTPGLGREPAMVGGIYPAPSPEANRQFFTRYRDLYGQLPPAIATHGYDAVALAAVLAAASQGRDTFSREAITAASGFAGVDGIFRFTPDGLSERGFAVMQLTRDGAAVRQPAPTTFEGLQY